MTTEKKSLGIQEIMDLLPHRYPFLMVDKVENYEISDERKTLRAIKNVSFNEPIFQGHFPAKPVFPGVLILEAMAQATGILAFTMVGKPSPTSSITLPPSTMPASSARWAPAISWCWMWSS